MSEKQFEELSKRLDILIKLTAINALKDKNLTEQVEILSSIDLQPKQIATILGTDPSVISSLKSRVKKRKGKEPKEETVQEKPEKTGEDP